MYNKLKFILGLFILTSLVMTSCIKEDFDEPELPSPCSVNSGLTPNVSTAGLLNLISQIDGIEGSSVKLIPDTSVVLSAKVISDDKESNFYKTLYLEDSEGAAVMSIEGSGLFNDYQVGQTVHINLSGLTVENNAKEGILKIGMGAYRKYGSIQGVGRIPVSAIYNYVKNQSCPSKNTPSDMDLVSSNKTDYVGRLVTLKNMQFAANDTSQTYADGANKMEKNLSLVDFFGNDLTLVTSGYANFANVKVPTGYGEITGVFTQAGDGKYELIIRDTSDVQFNNERAGTLTNPLDIASAIEFEGLEGVWAKGYIVGTYVNSWQGTYIDKEAPFTVNNIVCIAASATETDSTKMVLVILPQGEVKDSTNLVDHVDLLGEEIMYYGNLSRYYGLPSMNETEGYWLVDENKGNDPGDFLLFEDFATIPDPYAPIDIDGWKIVAEAGTEIWKGNSYDGESAQMSAEGADESSNIAWMISPKLDLASRIYPKLSFVAEMKYFAGDLLKVYISTDYDGGDTPQNFTWTELTEAHIVTNTDPTSSGWGGNIAESGKVELQNWASSPSVYIAWKYVGSGTGGQTTSYRVDDILIK